MRYYSSYDHLRVFGSLCYAYNIQRPKDKFESRSERCIFWEKGMKGYDL